LSSARLAASARQLPRRLGAAGCRLALVDLDRLALERTVTPSAGLGEPPLTFAADITDRPQVDAVAPPSGCFSAVDLLVNAAGTNTADRTLDTMSPQQWEKVVAVNLTGPFHCVQAFLPLLRERGAVIVIIASTTAILVSPGGGAHYCAAKRAVALPQRVHQHGAGQARYPRLRHPARRGQHPAPRQTPRTPGPSAAPAVLQPGDVAEAVYFVATRPAHVTISDLVIWPTVQIAGIHTV